MWNLGLVLFDSQKDVVSANNFGFWQDFGFSGEGGGGRGSCRTEIINFGYALFLPIINFGRLLRGCVCLKKDVPLVEILANLSQILQNGPFHGCCIATKTFQNLTTTNAALIKLTTIMYFHKIFNLARDWGVTHRA